MSIQYNVKRPFNYASDGEQVECSFIELFEPTGQNKRECAYMRQAFFRAINDEQQNRTDEQKEKAAAKAKEISDTQAEVIITADDILSGMAGSQVVNYPEFIDVGVKLLCSQNGLAKVDGVKNLTSRHCDIMSNHDLEYMIGTYVANFIVQSALQET